MQTGLIGLGRMGSNMTLGLLHTGHNCVVFNNAPKTLPELEQQGAPPATSPGDWATKPDAPRTISLMVPLKEIIIGR